MDTAHGLVSDIGDARKTFVIDSEHPDRSYYKRRA